MYCTLKVLRYLNRQKNLGTVDDFKFRYLTSSIR
jgi:hypothetical protein